jgi:hypothetical protein
MCAVCSLFFFLLFNKKRFSLFGKKIEIDFFDKLYGVNERNNNLALI